MTTLWDTTGSDVVHALEAERRSAGALAFGLALTLVVVTDQNSVAEAEAAAKAAPGPPLPDPAGHPPAPRGPRAAPGRRGPDRRPAGAGRGRRHAHVRPARAARGVGRPAAAGPRRPGRHLVARRDPGQDRLRPARGLRRPPGHRKHVSDDPLAALHQRAADYAPGDTDLSWARTTSWRALLAAAFDSLSATPKSAMVTGAETPPTALLVGWLRSKLGIDVHLKMSGRDIQEVSFELSDNGAASEPAHQAARRAQRRDHARRSGRPGHAAAAARSR